MSYYEMTGSAIGSFLQHSAAFHDFYSAYNEAKRRHLHEFKIIEVRSERDVPRVQRRIIRWQCVAGIEIA